MEMGEVILYRPQLEELQFRAWCMGDAETMTYNHACGGTIPFPQERWADWYTRWVEDGTGERFYRYLLHRPSRTFVGNVAYRYEEKFDGFVCEILVAAPYRGRGFGRRGLELLCAAARENGVKRLADDIAVDNPSVGLFLSAGFCERFRNEEYILVEKEL